MFLNLLAGGTTLAAQVANILRKYGTDAHVYLPGIGVINGLTAGNYLDSAGTTAATVDNPVGLVLDGAGSVGAELVDTMNSASAWGVYGTNTVAEDGANGVKITYVDNTQGAFAYFAASGGLSTNLTVGKYYRLTGQAKVNAGASVTLQGSWSSTTPIIATVTSTEFVDFSINIICGSPNTDFIRTINMAVGEIIWLRNISVKEVTGIHALQATTANKPILRRGAVNLLTYSEQFDNAAWVKQGVLPFGSGSTANAIAAPNGTLTADKIVESSTTGVHRLDQVIAVSAIPYTTSVYAKAGGSSWLQLRDATSTAGVWFNINTGVIGAVASGSSGTIKSVGDGWYRCTATRTAIAGSNTYSIALANADNSNSYTGDGTSGIYIWGAQLETGSVATDYIPTTTAAASSATGNYHWVHDSTDVLTATFPAGYEAATTINASTAGQATLTAQNIVGAYNIGPSIDTYGRFIFKTIEASELAIVQSYCNRLAGV